MSGLQVNGHGQIIESGTRRSVVVLICVTVPTFSSPLVETQARQTKLTVTPWGVGGRNKTPCVCTLFSFSLTLKEAGEWISRVMQEEPSEHRGRFYFDKSPTGRWISQQNMYSWSEVSWFQTGDWLKWSHLGESHVDWCEYIFYIFPTGWKLRTGSRTRQMCPDI